MKTEHIKVSTQRYLAERAQDASGGLYLLLDRFLEPAIDMTAFLERLCHSEIVPLTHPAFSDEARRPVLIRIRPQDSDLIAATVDAAFAEQADPAVEGASGFSIGGWIEAECLLPETARHLARTMEQRQPSGVNRVLRLADRRVLEFTWMLLHNDQKACLLGPIKTWYVLDRCGELRSYSVPDVTGLGQRSNNSRLSLDGDQWGHLSRCQQVQELARGWRRFSSELPPGYLQQIDAALQAAAALGIENNQDALLLAAYILQIHPSLARHPMVAALVQRSLRAKVPLIDVLAEVSDPEGWDAIKKELDASCSTVGVNRNEGADGAWK